jgi:hypothetical protein
MRAIVAERDGAMGDAAMWAKPFGVIFALLWVGACAHPQQAADRTADVTVTRPMFARGQGPVVAIDEAHNNFHTLEGRYAPFAAVLANDGYRVTAFNSQITGSALRNVGVLVIANPLAAENVGRWRLPTPPAYTKDEASVLRTWVEQGGSLLLIIDHMPFPGAAGSLAQAFGFDFDNSHAVFDDSEGPERFTAASGLLARNEITQGRGPDTAVTEVRSFSGSSFRAPQKAIPLVRLDGRWSVLTPEEAWKFTAQTPQRPATTNDLRGAALKVGRGRVIVMSEAAMFTAQIGHGEPIGFSAPTASQNKQFLLNLLHWLSEPRAVAGP